MIPTPAPTKANDGTSIPWLAWGNGTGDASQHAVECGKLALASGIRHIDTAQLYKNERETGLAIRESGIPREDVHVTSKLSQQGPNDDQPIPIDEYISTVQQSLDRLGFVPDLYLIHNPYVARPGELKVLWNTLEDLKDAGKLKSIGVSNFRPQDLKTILDGAKYKPVVNQIEYHPYTLAHLEPLLALQKQHGILTATYGLLTPILRYPSTLPAGNTGGPLKPILDRVARRLSDSTVPRDSSGRPLNLTTNRAQEERTFKFDASVVLMLWARAMGVVVVTASGNEERIKMLGEVATLPGAEGLLTKEEVEEITRVGKGVHFRFYTEHMEKDFDLPTLPKN